MSLSPPSQRTWNVADIVTAAEMNANVRDSVNFLANVPIFLGYQITAQTIANSAFGYLFFDGSIVDTYGGHSTVTNNHLYVAQVPGWYMIDGIAGWTPNGTGRRITSIWVNGVEDGYSRGEYPPSATASSSCNCPAAGMPVFLNTGDNVALKVFQSSGGNLSTAANASTFSVEWMHA